MKRPRAQEKPSPYAGGRPLLFDTNVVVAALVERHPHHERAVLWLKRVLVGEVALFLAQHGLAESFAVLTVLPLKPAVTPDQAARLLRDGLVGTCKATVVNLTTMEYLDTITRCALRGMTGGVIHDAVIARCAEKAGAQVLTFNQRHFVHVCRNGAADIVAP